MILKDLKNNERGSITVFVLATMLLVTGVIFISYFSMMNKSSSQASQIEKIQEEYNQSNTMMSQAYDDAKANQYQTISILKEGDWVYYQDATGVTRKCIVLWDESSGYGTQIITQNTVGDVTLGSTDIDEAVEEYNKIIETLNDEAMKYLNTEYASDARCVGSVPNDKNSETKTYYASNAFKNNLGKNVKDSDENYILDNDQMNKLGIEYTETGSDYDYWLASRTNGFVTRSDKIRQGCVLELILMVILVFL